MTYVIELLKLLPLVLPALLEYFRRKPAPSPVPPPEPTPVIPPPVPSPGDTLPPTGDPALVYMNLKHAQSIATPFEGSLVIQLQENSWAGWRDPEAVVRFCPDVAPFKAEELDDFAKAGQALDEEGHVFLSRLPQENPKYPGRSVVRKLAYVEFQTRLEDHLDRAREYRDMLKGMSGYGEYYNSIKGWCEELRKNEGQ